MSKLYKSIVTTGTEYTRCRQVVIENQVNQYGASHNIAVFILSPQSDNGITFNGS